MNCAICLGYDVIYKSIVDFVTGNTNVRGWVTGEAYKHRIVVGVSFSKARSVKRRTGRSNDRLRPVRGIALRAVSIRHPNDHPLVGAAAGGKVVLQNHPLVGEAAGGYKKSCCRFEFLDAKSVCEMTLRLG